MLLKFAPVIVTDVPVGPAAGVNPLITGRTLKLLALVAVWPLTVTVIGPVVAVLGNVAAS